MVWIEKTYPNEWTIIFQLEPNGIWINSGCYAAKFADAWKHFLMLYREENLFAFQAIRVDVWRGWHEDDL